MTVKVSDLSDLALVILTISCKHNCMTTFKGGAYRNHRTYYPESYTLWITEDSKRLIHSLRRDFDVNVTSVLRKALEKELERLKGEYMNGR